MAFVRKRVADWTRHQANPPVLAEGSVSLVPLRPWEDDLVTWRRRDLDVRRLKALGLTESLETGYRLSPRGKALMAYLRSLTE